mmetsp:Transcript_5497/g.8599  ORF Transcript_5497/g.8599 Transcript_5497/m.8599 type:complete len:111 (+) Transcript_5497:2904-3236(+)
MQASELPQDDEDFQIRLKKVGEQVANPFQNFAFSKDKTDTNKDTSQTLQEERVDSSKQEKSFKDSSFDSSLSFQNNRQPIDHPHFTAVEDLRLNKTDEKARLGSQSSNLL